MKRVLAGLGVVVAVVAISASGAFAHGDDHGDDHGHGGGHHRRNAPTVTGAREIDVTATSYSFSPRRFKVDEGEDVTIVLTSEDTLHDLVLKGQGHIVAAKKGKTTRGGLMIDDPGTYRFYCSVPGHRAAGMKGTIVVD
jgi:plastocyanin